LIVTNDAKVGLVVGVGMVVLIAVLFYRNEGGSQAPVTASTASVATASRQSSGDGSGGRRTATATSAALRTERRAGSNHTVKEGESLFSLARDYYGDGRQYMLIFRANEKVLGNPDNVPPGTVLFVPDLPPAERAIP
jgi:nucleoid-associated protein YgaU